MVGAAHRGGFCQRDEPARDRRRRRQQDVRWDARGRGCDRRRRAGRAGGAPRTERIGQDDPAAHHRRLRDRPTPAPSPSAGGWSRATASGRSPSAAASAWSSRTARSSRTSRSPATSASATPVPGGSTSAWRLVGLADRSGSYPHELSGRRAPTGRARHARSHRNPRSCCSTSRSRRSTRVCASTLREEVAAILREAGRERAVRHPRPTGSVVARRRRGRDARRARRADGEARGRLRGSRPRVGSPSSSVTPRCCPAPRRTASSSASWAASRPSARFVGAVDVVVRPELLVDQRRQRFRRRLAERAFPRVSSIGRTSATTRWSSCDCRVGEHVRSRSVGTTRWQAGDEVRVAVSGPVSVIPSQQPRRGRHLSSRLALPTRTRFPIVVAVCVALAVASCSRSPRRRRTTRGRGWSGAASSRRLHLDTLGGPAWKPLPVGVTTVLSPFGERAPTLWLVVSRAAGLLTVVAVYRLATRFAGRGRRTRRGRAAAPHPRRRPPLRAVGARGPQRAGHRGAGAVGDRPSSRRSPPPPCCSGLRSRSTVRRRGPSSRVYALWLWRRDPAQRALVAIVLPASCRCSGSVATGGGRGARGTAPMRRRSSPTRATALVDALHRVAEIVVVPAWFAAAFAVVDARADDATAR